jgi:hypothetical protein
MHTRHQNSEIILERSFKKEWQEEIFYSRKNKIIKLNKLLRKIRKRYDALLKFNHENPWIMLTGAELSEEEIIKIKQKAASIAWQTWGKKEEGPVCLVAIKRPTQKKKKKFIVKYKPAKNDDTVSLFPLFKKAKNEPSFFTAASSCKKRPYLP